MDLITTVPTGGGFFKAKDHIGSLAFIVEPKELLEKVPSSNPKFKAQDQIVADVTEFLNNDMLDGKLDPIVHTRVRITGGGMVNSFKDSIGKAIVGKIVMKNNPRPGEQDFPVFVNADPAAVDKVVEYAKRQEEAEKAAAEDMPDFLK